MQINENIVQERLAFIGHIPAEAPMWIFIIVRMSTTISGRCRMRIIYDYHCNALSSYLARASQLSMLAKVLAWNSGLDRSREFQGDVCF